MIHCKHDEMIEANTLRLNPRNPNRHPDNQIKLLAKIIENQGWRVPVIVSKRSDLIVSGHCRVQAALQLKDQSVPVVYQEFESDAEEWAHMIADNRIAELADMDNSALKDLLSEMDTGALDMELTGYDGTVLENLMTQFHVDDPAAEWNGMPEFNQQDKTAFKSIVTHFKDQEAVNQFAETVGQNITPQTRMIWYPEIEIGRTADKIYK